MCKNQQSMSWRNGRVFLLLSLPLLVLWFAGNIQAHHVSTNNYWNTPNGNPPNNVQHCTFESNYLNANNDIVGINVYTPPGYENNNNRYPVIYVLHGISGDEYNYFGWFNNVYNQRSILSLIEGTVQSDLPVPDALVVFVNGGVQSYYNNFTDGHHGPNSPFPILSESIILDEVIPVVDTHFRTIPIRSGRAIEGFSMGGRGALKFAFKNPDMFCSVVAYAGAPFEEITQPPNSPYAGPLPLQERMSYITENNADAILQRDLFIRLVVGNDDNAQQRQNIDLEAQLTDLNIPHEAELYLPNIGHEWDALYNARGEEGLNFHYQCFQQANQPPQFYTGAPPVFLPLVIMIQTTIPDVPALSCE